MSLAELERHIINGAGWCVACEAMTAPNDVPPQARGLDCPACGERKLVGAEEAGTFMGLIPVEQDQ